MEILAGEFCHTENDFPQPQLFTALGFLKRHPRAQPSSPRFNLGRSRLQASHYSDDLREQHRRENLVNVILDLEERGLDRAGLGDATILVLLRDADRDDLPSLDGVDDERERNLIRALGERIPSLHAVLGDDEPALRKPLKDLRKKVHSEVGPKRYSYVGSVIKGVFTVPGDGDMVDWDGVFKVIKNSDYKGWIVVEAEQDPFLYDPLEYAQKARAFIKKGLDI